MFPTHLNLTEYENYQYNRAVSHQINTRKINLESNHQIDQFSIQILKKRKQQVENAKEQLINTMSKYKRLKKQVQKNEKMANMAKHTCIKLYDIRKLKLMNKSLFDEKKRKEMQESKLRIQNVKKIKLEEKYYQQLLKNQDIFRKLQIREEFKKYKFSVNQAICFKHKLMQQQARQKCAMIKNEEQRSRQKRKLLENKNLEKCRQNYISKLQKQIKRITIYNDLMLKLENHKKSALQDLDKSKLIQSKAYQEFSSILKPQDKRERESFFLTERNNIKSTVLTRRSSVKN